MTATPFPSAIAATATVTVSPTSMRSNNMARPRVVALPSEMVAMVLSDVEHDRATLMSVMRSNKEMFEHAVRLYWVLVNPSNRLLGKLSSMTSLGRQQVYAQHIQRLHIDVAPLTILPPLYHIRFNKLRELIIIYKEAESSTQLPHAPTGCHIGISHLSNPSLEVLKFGDEPFTPGRYSTGNFLPHLAGRCPNLRTLSIRSEVMGASPRCLIRVVEGCKELRGLSINSHASALIDAQALKHIAAHPRLFVFRTDKLITASDVRFALSDNGPSPFGRLRWMCLETETEAAVLMVPHTPKLEIMELMLSGPGNIFAHLHNLEKLNQMTLIFTTDQVILTEDDFNAVIPHTSLRVLELSPLNTANLYASSVSVTALLRIFAALPKIRTLRLLAHNRWNVDLLVGLGRLLPRLERLEIAGTYDFSIMESLLTAIFPRLTYLCVTKVKDIGGPGTLQHRA
ncbi:hypothetical protein D6D06_10071 [Aureobasidium pullulans]|nr:hypothetical protein D6D06_10071 [Aureobasidium pullulans]